MFFRRVALHGHPQIVEIVKRPIQTTFAMGGGYGSQILKGERLLPRQVDQDIERIGDELSRDDIVRLLQKRNGFRVKKEYFLGIARTGVVLGDHTPYFRLFIGNHLV